MNEYTWVVFYNKKNGKKLGAISVEGLFAGEIEETKKLYAYDNDISFMDIEVKLEK